MTVWQWPLELVLIALLGATLFYALRLERSIAVLRQDRAGMGDVLATIRKALDDAERGLQSLQNMAEVAGRGLAVEIEAATTAQQDLQFALERVESVSRKVESVIKSARLATAEEAARAAGPGSCHGLGSGHSKAERDLLKVLRLSK